MARYERPVLVESHSDKQGAASTYKKHLYGLHPILVSCANTGEVLAVLLRNGNAGSNTVADRINVLSEAVAQLPPRYRRRIIFRADGAGATKDLLAWVKTEAAQHGYTWHYSVEFDVTEPVREAITDVPTDVWAPALTPENEIRRGAQVTEITALLSLADAWPPDMRVLARTEPLHPRHRQQAAPSNANAGGVSGHRHQPARPPLPPAGRLPPQSRHRHLCKLAHCSRAAARSGHMRWEQGHPNARASGS